jgi:hypothetical protein
MGTFRITGVETVGWWTLDGYVSHHSRQDVPRRPRITATTVRQSWVFGALP